MENGNLTEKELKKLHKKAKKEKAKQEEAEAMEIVADEESKEERKRKRTESESADAAATETNGIDKKEKKKKKKKNKDRSDGEEKNGHLNGHQATNGELNGHSNGADHRTHFYQEHKAVRKMTADEVADYRSKHSIQLEDLTENNEYKPITQFDHLIADEDIKQALSEFKEPSPIQAQCWPVILSGRDVVGIAATGSGKTLAFGLPALIHIAAQEPLGKKVNNRGPIMLVLAPTRELAMQTDVVCSKAGQSKGIKSVCVYGGVEKSTQRSALSKGAHIVVATPGRLLDLIEEQALTLHRVTYLVLDEADRMLDLGFEKDIRAIIGKLRKDRQTLMFSATWPVSIQALAADFLRNPVKVTIGSQDLAASHSIKQIVEVIEPQVKDRRLEQLLKEYAKTPKTKIVIFVLYKKEAARVEQFLQSRGWKAIGIHGDKGQHDRTQALQKFKDGVTPLLIATDVAARGLDIPNVEYVINYTFPLTVEDYVHRIGRTGRAGKTGTSHTLFTSFDKAHSGELINVLKEAKQPVPEELMKFGTHTKKKEHKLYGQHFKEVTTLAAPKKITFDDDD